MTKPYSTYFNKTEMLFLYIYGVHNCTNSMYAMDKTMHAA